MLPGQVFTLLYCSYINRHGMCSYRTLGHWAKFDSVAKLGVMQIMTFMQCIDFLIWPSTLKIFHIKTWEICTISTTTATIKLTWGFPNSVLWTVQRYFLKYQSLYPIDSQTEAWIKKPRKLNIHRVSVSKWGLRIYISRKFLGCCHCCCFGDHIWRAPLAFGALKWSHQTGTQGATSGNGCSNNYAC